MSEFQAPPLAAGTVAPRRGVAGTLEAWLGGAVETVAAALVALEILILFGGVVSRYVFDAPLVWSDELASILFLWLAMLGAAIALRRDEHMRMTAAVARLPASARATFDAIASAAALAFLVLIAWPACDFAREQIPVTTPALQISDALRAAALPVGIVLMAAFSFLRLVRAASPRALVVALVA